MKNSLKLVLLTLSAFLLTQCLGGINDREDCDGNIELINPIPDTTVSLSQDTLFIDLSGSEESIFRHTASKGMIFSFGGTARITQRYKNGNPNMGKEALIILEKSGIFEATIFAMDDCDKRERDDFELTITN